MPSQIIPERFAKVGREYIESKWELLEKIKLQNLLFGSAPGRSELISHTLLGENKPNKRIFIIRNHSFELIENTIAPFLEFSETFCEFSYSDYDDSMQLTNLDESSDLVIVWFDLDKLDNTVAIDFLTRRVGYLRNIYSGPIIVASLGGNISIDESRDVYSFEVEKLISTEDFPIYDNRMSKITGTRLSASALLQLSRVFGLELIPERIGKKIKIVVCDLDNTLYKGVLGEDGIQGLTIDLNQRALQEKIRDLSLQGVPVFIATKNDEPDVLEMLKQRTDFPLRLEHITKIYASWNAKSETITKIEEFTNTFSDSYLFIDDNVAEIHEVLSAHPQIRVLHAEEEPHLTLRAWEGFLPLMNKPEKDSKIDRKTDLNSNQIRNELSTKKSAKQLLSELNTKITFSVDSISQIGRLSELANKTNQFILTYKRYSEIEIEKLMSSDDSIVVGVSVKDDLSDSGVIAAVFLTKEDGILSLEEATISCRALGRGLEELILLGSMKLAAEKLQLNEATIKFMTGPKNKPAAGTLSVLENSGHGERFKPLAFDFPYDELEIAIDKGEVLENET